MSASILGLGTALPPEAVDQREAALHAAVRCCGTDGQSRTLNALYRRSGVRTRRSVLIDPQRRNGEPGSFFPTPGEQPDHGPTTAQRMARYANEAGALAIDASRSALIDASIDPAAVTHLVTVSCTGFAAPGVDIELIKELGLDPSVERTHVGFMGCHGALNGLRVARAIVEADATAVVLVCCVELCTLHFAYGWQPDRLVANALFADGAAAAVVSRLPRERSGATSLTSASTPNAALTIASTASRIFPESTDAMTWSIGDHGFAMTLSPRVPELIEAQLRPWLQSWLAEHGLTIGEVGSWAVHPGGPRILGQVAHSLELEDDRLAVSRSVLSDCGNMSSPTVLFIIDRLRAAHAPKPIVALAFGPGLTAEGTLIL